MSKQAFVNETKTNFGARQHFLDWIRVLAFAFLIFYHTGMMFVDWGFHIESGHNSTFLKSIMILSSQWRLDILFLVSGVAISFMIAKMPLKSFIRQRVIKLYIPLLFAIAVVVAPQSYYEAIQKGIFEGGFWQFWTTQYFTFSWDQRMIAPFPTYNHMWYVLYLFHYTLVLVPLFVFINSQRGKTTLENIEKWISKGTRILWVPLAMYLGIYLAFDNHDTTHAFIDDWYGHSIYLLATVLGLLLVRMPSVWQAFENNRYLALVVGIFSYAIMLAMFLLPNEQLPFDHPLMWPMAKLLVKWSWIVLLIGFAKRYMNYNNKALKYCNSIVYPFFILHQSITIILGFYVINWGLSGTFEFFVIVVGTFLGCWLITEGLIKRTNLLRLLFGLNTIPSKTSNPKGVAKTASY
jgi:hypothetical protein